MSVPAGQAARDGALHAAGGAGRLLHRVVQLILALVIVLCIAVVALAVRLGQGPLDVTWLARRGAAAAAGQGVSVSVTKAELTWEGIRGGLDRPIDLVLAGVELHAPTGASVLVVPRASVALATRALLTGHVALRAVELDGLRLKLRRAEDGTTQLDLDPPLPATSNSPSSAPSSSLWDQLRRAHIHNSAIALDDRQLGLVWTIDDLDIDLLRTTAGGAAGTAKVAATLGGEKLFADARIALFQDGGISIAADVAAFNPARLANVAPKLAPLAALDAMLGLSGTLTLDAAQALRTASLKVKTEAGTFHVGDGIMPVRAVAISAEATSTSLDLHLDQLRMQARDDAQPTTITGHVAATRAAGKVDAKITVDIDQVAFTDLAALWPAGTGGPGTRPWITKNLTAGLAHDGHVELALTAPEDFSDATLTSISGGILGSDVTGWWLRPVPPVEHGEARVVFVDPDTMDILISTGRQQGMQLALHPSKVRLTGIAGHDQFIAITADLFGPFADVIGLLRNPKIKLLDRRPVPINNPTGQATALLTVNLPLKNNLDLDNVAIHAVGKLKDGHIGGIAVGRDIDRAQLDYDVSNDGLKITGSADLAAIPSQLKVDMDFRTGGPTQVLERIGVTASVSPRQLAAAGLDTMGLMTGTLGVQLDYLDRRDTTADVHLTGDLRPMGVSPGRMGWTKKEGADGMLDAHVLLKAGRVVSIERVQAQAPGLAIDASADAAGGKPNLVRVRKLMLGTTTNVTGQIRLPERDGDAYVADISGPTLDLSPEFDRKSQPKPKGAAPTRGPAFKVDLKLGRLLLAGGRQMTDVSAHAENDGLITNNASLQAIAGTGKLTMSLTPVRGGRTLAAQAQDAGAMLRAAGVMETMSGGQLTVAGSYDDTDPAHPLRGTADLVDFRLRNAPAIGRILQAMTLYGLVEIAQGPGLGFDRMVVPFHLREEVLTLEDARAYSASLGFTAKGSVDLAHDTADLEGTVIPAYFFNSLLGRVPLLGRIFSPEKGGGLFAVNYSISGPLADPKVGVNPLSALTPGFLRGFFDIFDTPRPNPASRPPIAEHQK